MKFDDAKLREALQSIQSGPITAADASAIIDVARFAASVDGRMDLGEMSTVARVARIIHVMSGGTDAPVPSTPVTLDWVRAISQKVTAKGPRELAYAVAHLIVLADGKVTKEETSLDLHLANALRISTARAEELHALIDRVVTSSTP